MEATTGDRIRTKKYAHELSYGDIVTLSYDVEFFSVNNSTIICNGETLGRNYQAKYIETETERCHGGQLNDYAIFILI